MKIKDEPLRGVSIGMRYNETYDDGYFLEIDDEGYINIAYKFPRTRGFMSLDAFAKMVNTVEGTDKTIEQILEERFGVTVEGGL